MAQIDDFKANLIGGGARANQFRITITPPPGIAIGLDVRRASFLVTTAGLPAVEMNFIQVPFRGRNIQYPGDRSDPADRDDTILKSYILRNCFPSSIAAIPLSNAQADAIETFDVTWKYTHFEASGVNF